ncbi:MAG: hypothetical protein RR348_04180, partial [Clostridia bacterium]
MSLILPITINKDCDYSSALKKAFNEFKLIIKQDADPEVFKIADKICKKLLDVVDLYYKPDIARAVAQMKNVVAIVLENAPSSKTSANALYKVDKTSGVKLPNETYYRARINESSED